MAFSISIKVMKILGLCCSTSFVNSVMLKTECPLEEVHRSCSFYEEYACWAKEDQIDRIKIVPQRLAHCKSGCFCKPGFVREYVQGPCIQAADCRDQKLKTLLEKLPKKFPGIIHR